jgi:hypothetical protein
MGSSRDDVIGLFEYVWQRFSDRMDGLTDAEWKWEPIADDRVTLRWRLQHIAEVLRAEHNGPWLGLAAELAGAPPEPATSAAAAMWDVGTAYATWHGLLAETTDESLDELIGAAGFSPGCDRRTGRAAWPPRPCGGPVRR